MDTKFYNENYVGIKISIKLIVVKSFELSYYDEYQSLLRIADDFVSPRILVEWNHTNYHHMSIIAMHSTYKFCAKRIPNICNIYLYVHCTLYTVQCTRICTCVLLCRYYNYSRHKNNCLSCREMSIFARYKSQNQ